MPIDKQQVKKKKKKKLKKYLKKSEKKKKSEKGVEPPPDAKSAQSEPETPTKQAPVGPKKIKTKAASKKKGEGAG